MKQNNVPWYHTSREPPVTGAGLIEHISADVAVIGGGVAGLATALALVDEGASVVVLEAGQAGDGASGRNGGLIVPIARLHPEDIIKNMGETGERLVNAIVQSADQVFRLVERFNIDCDPVRKGFMQPVHAECLLAATEKTALAWQNHGASCTFIDANATKQHLGTGTYYGALFEPAGGYVNPLAYTRGLARAALTQGVEIFSNSRVMETQRENGKTWRLSTASGGSVKASTVIQCVGVSSPGLAGLPGANATAALLPMVLHGLATYPLPREIHEKILPGRVAATDTRNYVLSIGYDSANRLVTSGAAPLGDNMIGEAQMKYFVRQRLKRVYPTLGDVDFEFVWKGKAALNTDWIPKIVEAAPNWFSLTSCNGRGMAISTMLGSCLGLALSRNDFRELPVPCISPKRVLLRRTTGAILARVLMPLGTIQDRWRE